MILDKTLRELLNELHFHAKMLRDETIDHHDFSNAVEEIIEHYDR